MFFSKKTNLILALVVSSMLASSDTFSQVASKANVVEIQGVSGEVSQFSCESKDGKIHCRPLESNRIVFNTTNLVSLHGPITQQSASKFVDEFHSLELRDELGKIYVYVRSPGGSIFAGDTIANIIRSSKKQVVVVVDIAASMAFHITMTGTKRVMLPTGTLMQHHASGAPGAGEFPNVDKQWSWIKRKVDLMQKYEASRCKNISLEQFTQNIDRDWWLLAPEALEVGCIDEVAQSVTCSKDLLEKDVKETVSFFGLNITLVWSGCPLVAYPRSVAITNQAGYKVRLSNEETQAVDDFLVLMSDPMRYYQKYNSFSTDPLKKVFENNKTATRTEY